MKIIILFLFLSLITSLNIQKQNQNQISSGPSHTIVRSFLENYKYYTSNNITSLSIQTSLGSDALIKFMVGSSHTILMALLAETGSFTIRNERISILEISSGNNIYSEASSLKLNSLKIMDVFSYKNINQWKLIVQETYYEEPTGWTNNSISQCGGLYLLGGYGKFSGGEVSKEFCNLPPHTMVRIVANYHFIDAWQGELGYMMANIGRDKKNEYLWSEKHDYSKYLKSTDVCGNKYPENKLTSCIEVVFAHNDNTVKITFGSTLDADPKENSFGISFLQIYLR